MPKLMSKHQDNYKEPQLKKTPVMSERRTQTVKKLESKLAVAARCIDLASNQHSHFERKYNSVPNYQCETVIGSDLAHYLLPRSQDKYHMVRWDFALRAAGRRLSRLNKLLKSKLKGYE